MNYSRIALAFLFVLSSAWAANNPDVTVGVVADVDRFIQIGRSKTFKATLHWPDGVTKDTGKFKWELWFVNPDSGSGTFSPEEKVGNDTCETTFTGTKSGAIHVVVRWVPDHPDQYDEDVDFATIYVVKLAGLIVTDAKALGGDNYVATKSTGDVTIEAVLDPNFSADLLPPNFIQWTGGRAGENQCERKVTKTISALTDIMTQCGTSYDNVAIVILGLEISTLGFKNDHMITKWIGGAQIDSPDGSTPIWKRSANPNDPVCYTKNAAPTMFGKFAVTPDISSLGISISNVGVRGKTGSIDIGSQSGLSISGTELVATNVTGGGAIPGSVGVIKLTPAIDWEFTIDAGSTWSDAGASGPIIFYFTEDNPVPKLAALTSEDMDSHVLYDLALEKSCTWVNGDADIPGKLTSGIDGNVDYNPGANHEHGLRLIPAGSGECCCHGILMERLLRSVGVEGKCEYFFGGYPGTKLNYLYKIEGITGGISATFQCNRPAHDSQAVSMPHFSFHVMTLCKSTWYDSCYGVSCPDTAPGLASGFPEMYQVAWFLPATPPAAINVDASVQHMQGGMPGGYNISIGCPHVVPAAPTGLTATVLPSSSISLTWTDNSGIETSYVIRRKPQGSGSFVDIASVGANSTNYSDAGLAPSTAYEYTVYATSSGGGSDFSNTATATTPAP